MPPLSKEGSDYLQLTVLFFIIFISKDLIDYVNLLTVCACVFLHEAISAVLIYLW